ncbi:MAG TPA: glutamate--tRNA ligase [Candidatus Polarisedimenticolia bacterium]|nr:glutamate--tRNA ligase [Candidatus Polarisedimenticolia bacterium]
MTVRTRFAPSPTGRLHVGNARTAVFNWLFTRRAGGRFILRIEDTDQERSTREFEAGILAELRWLGLDWDEGVDSGDSGPYRQSERRDRYEAAFRRLLEKGEVYYCFCTPEQREADRGRDLKEGRPPRYPGRCRELPAEEVSRRMFAGERPAARFRILEGTVEFEDLIRGPIAFDSRQIGDPVILRGDGWPTYNFAVVVDDVEMEITHVIRGEDHITNTPRQLLLYRALGAAPPRFAHLPLVLGPDHAPLSKRHGDTSLWQYQEKGYLPEAILNYLALLGWSSPTGKEILSPEELVAEFDLERVGRAAGVLDPVKLDWVANQHLRRAEINRLVDLAIPILEAGGELKSPVSPGHRAWLISLLDLLKPSVSSLSQIRDSDAMDILLRFNPENSLSDPEVRKDLGDPRCREVIRTFASLVPSDSPLDAQTYKQAAQETGKRTGTKGRDLYHPIRVALTARVSGPELVKLVPLIEEASRLEFPSPVPGCFDRATSIANLAGEAL